MSNIFKYLHKFVKERIWLATLIMIVVRIGTSGPMIDMPITIVINM